MKACRCAHSSHTHIVNSVGISWCSFVFSVSSLGIKLNANFALLLVAEQC